MAPSASRSPFPIDAITIKIHRSPCGIFWRGRTELAALLAVLAAWLRVSWWLGSYSWSLAVLGGVVLVLVLVPWSRRFLLARFWCTFTRHRLQRVFWELRLHTRAGHLPWVLRVRPTPVGVRAWVLLRAGMTFEDFEESADAIAAACGARDCRVTASARWSWLIAIDVIRRDALGPGHVVRSPLAELPALDLDADAVPSWPDKPLVGDQS
jgi:hypothetical protein